MRKLISETLNADVFAVRERLQAAFEQEASTAAGRAERKQALIEAIGYVEDVVAKTVLDLALARWSEALQALLELAPHAEARRREVRRELSQALRVGGVDREAANVRTRKRFAPQRELLATWKALLPMVKLEAKRVGTLRSGRRPDLLGGALLSRLADGGLTHREMSEIVRGSARKADVNAVAQGLRRERRGAKAAEARIARFLEAAGRLGARRRKEKGT